MPRGRERRWRGRCSFRLSAALTASTPSLSHLLLLCQRSACDRLVRDGRGWLQEVPDAAGEVSFEAADGVAVRLAFGVLARDVVTGLGVAAGASDRDAVDRGVDLAVA